MITYEHGFALFIIGVVLGGGSFFLAIVGSYRRAMKEIIDEGRRMIVRANLNAANALENRTIQRMLARKQKELERRYGR